MSLKSILNLAIVMAFYSCQENNSGPSGNWRAELYLQNDTLPFNFIIEDSAELKLWLINGNEKILVEDVLIEKDSIKAQMHIFDTELRAKIIGNSMKGVFEKKYAQGYVLSFSAQKGIKYRFSEDPKTNLDISGKWAVQFESEAEDSTLALGKFSQNGSKVEGTFLTITGDYRFLDGEVDGNQLKLSCFDGEHAFLFKARLGENDELSGYFKSGISWNETWTAQRNNSVELKDAYQLTYLKEGYDSIYFAFPDMNGDTVKFPNPQLKGKVVLVQIFGTWCPNCMDETKFLADWYKKNKDRGLEILAVAFERKNDLDYAAERVQKVKDKLGANYTFLFGGPSDKQAASEAFPMLNQVMSFPTLIFIDRNGIVQKIHTGFSGPGTGLYYEKFVKEFEILSEELLEEK
ncbi:TlpA family protein disulfide reductase [Hyphobacterium sp. CCMP332]|nr:TlpA family protein disulfide reductase [Hyphobacterium sp. CCMP332]